VSSKRLQRSVTRAVAAVVLAGGILLFMTLPTSAVDTLTLSPNHGQAADSFTASYSLSADQFNDEATCEQFFAEFKWGNTFMGSGDFVYSFRPPLGPQIPARKSCRASRQITPPSSDRNVGVHQVSAERFKKGQAQKTQVGNDQADYTIDPAPSPSPSPSPSPTKKGASGGSTSGGGTAPSPSPTASPSPSPSPTASPLTDVAASETRGISGLLVALIAAAAILIGLGGGWLIFRSRGKGGPTPPADADTMVS
jgi:hypothetical protein